MTTVKTTPPLVPARTGYSDRSAAYRRVFASNLVALHYASQRVTFSGWRAVAQAIMPGYGAHRKSFAPRHLLVKEAARFAAQVHPCLGISLHRTYEAI